MYSLAHNSASVAAKCSQCRDNFAIDTLLATVFHASLFDGEPTPTSEWIVFLSVSYGSPGSTSLTTRRFNPTKAPSGVLTSASRLRGKPLIDPVAHVECRQGHSVKIVAKTLYRAASAASRGAPSTVYLDHQGRLV